MGRCHEAAGISKILGRGEHSDKKRWEGRKTQGCVREINPSLRHDRNMLNYFVLHFIGMYTPYLVACESPITQRESTVKDRENKNTDKNVPEIGII